MSIWKIKKQKEGIFTVDNPHLYSDLYFPLTNTQGSLFSWITAYLSGDIKTCINSYLTHPATIFDIKNPFCTRTLWLYFSKKDVVNLSPLWPTKDEIKLEAGPLWHRLIRKNKSHNLHIEITNFVPQRFSLEIMWIKITNKAHLTRSFIPISSIPLFCRHQQNLFDHRHVTSLLNRAHIKKQGILIKPSMSFDEQGHKANKTNYFVLADTDKKRGLKGAFASLDEFCGNAGNLIFPQSIYENRKPKRSFYLEGKELIAGLKFKKQTLKPKETLNIFLIMGLTQKNNAEQIFTRFNSLKKIKAALGENKRAWQKIFNRTDFESGNHKFDFWLKWVNIQPTLRTLFGCSFLGHFDYGKGGRGWRDLWQDILSIIIFNPGKIKQQVINNFKGVRIDGSNATIITQDGNFVSDRNKISRVWMDHGIWPCLALKLYVDRTADYNILFKSVSYFRDHQLKRAREQDLDFLKNKCTDYTLKDKKNRIYKSSLLEHVLIQNIVPFFNLGRQGNIKLENADWNDALDMAPDAGESVAFSCMYAYNLKSIADLLTQLKKNKKIKTIELTQEMGILLGVKDASINYFSPHQKNKLLNRYLEATKYKVRGKKVRIPIQNLINDLNEKGDFLTRHIQRKEWLKSPGFFNGYYDNDSRRVEGKFKDRTKMMLASQVFPILSGVAETHHIVKISKSLLRYLKDKDFYVFRLNTDFGHLKLNLGRAFGFSFGDKENGSIFCHMNVLLAFALYQQGFVKEGYKIFQSLFTLASQTAAQVMPCIPEYFNLTHKGLYSYLTGSASWFIYLFISQIAGIQFSQGMLCIEPKLLKDQFLRSSKLKLSIHLEGKRIEILYANPHKKSWPHYSIKQVRLNNKNLQLIPKAKKIHLPASNINRLLNHPTNRLEIIIS